jgi:hypothetical protein
MRELVSVVYAVVTSHLRGCLLTCYLVDVVCRLFTEEPVDFVRKVHDPLGDWLSPLIAATNLLQVRFVPL